MSKILFTFERDMPTVSTMREAFLGFSDEWKITPTFKRITCITKDDINNNDIIFMIRPEDVLSASTAKNARESGAYVITFCDDDLLNLPKAEASIPWREKALKKVLENSDAVISSSRYLCERYAKMTAGKKYAIIDTVVQDSEFNTDNIYSENGKIKIVYAASASHVSLFDANIKPVLKDLAEKYGNMISLNFVGVRPDLEEYKNILEINYHSGMPLREYRKFMADQHYDIGLAPGADTDFFKCKYFNKFIEYTLQGMVGIYSNLEPYTSVVRDKENGFLTDNIPEKWLEALSTAIENKELRQKCVENAVNYLRFYHTENKILEKLLTDIPELKEYNKHRIPYKTYFLNKLAYYFSRLFDKIYLAFYYLINTGLSGFINKLKIHFREGKAYK